MGSIGDQNLALKAENAYLGIMTKDTTSSKNNASLDKEDAIRKLIRQTIGSMGSTAPEALPHDVRQRLEGQIGGDADFEKLLKDVLKERGEGPGRG